MSLFWHLWVVVLTLGNIAGIYWLIRWTSKRRPGEVAEGAEMEHVWDGDLRDYNNPLPRWWLWMFYGTIVFALGYLTLFPGLGRFEGWLGWTQENQWEREVQRAEAQYGPIYANYAKQDVAALAANPEAVKTGRRLFLNYCATCHGSDARGARGFPNLTDGEWQWGGEPDTIKQTVLHGRQAIMPVRGLTGTLTDAEVDEVVHHVLSLSGRDADAGKAAAGQALFMAQCMACHGPEGKGNPMLGAPDLTNDIWLYGGGVEDIRKTISQGRQGLMPNFSDFLGEERVHLLAAYVYSLSQH
ncbi:MAG: cytochrome-c oxidase, cbb3-type subunit III [Ectothiorhodospiraceae bacterium]|nr:cytochrome-c oxidase, cbb3-type subunit III [Ectothiorhodospiraceae bacterium]